MTILRQGRWLRLASARPSTFSFTTAAVLGVGLLLPGSLPAASHTHHPLARSLHSTVVTDTGTHHAGGKHGKAAAGQAGSGRSRANARSTAAPADGRRSGKKGKGRREAEPPADLTPMFRAGRGAAPLVHGGSHAARGHHEDARTHGYNEPAPLLYAGRRSSHSEAPYTSLAEVANRESRVTRHAAPAAVHSAPRAAASPAARTPSRPVEVASRDRAPFASAPVARGESYAEGVSHPDLDERLPRSRSAAADTDDDPLNASISAHLAPAPSPAPTAHVSAAPGVLSRSAVAPASQPAVVQGFGGEVAVPSAASGADRPGGTHRRSHPSNWTPESLVTPPQPLEEREAITEAAVRPSVLPDLYDRNGRLMMPPPLKGSHDVLVHQNLMADNDGLDRIADDVDLDRMRAAHLLVPFPASEGLRINEALPYNRRVARPWAVSFADDMARAFYAHFRDPLVVTSAVRTVRYQARLQMVNGNAAATYGDAASPHLTGQAIDFGKRGMSQAELAWMRGYLLPLMRAGKIDVEEEFHQACFHISVYRSYAPARPFPRHEVAQARPVPVQADEASEAQDVE